MAYPDIVALLRTYLLPSAAGATIAGRVPKPRPDRLWQVRRVGGTQLRPVRDRPRVDVLCWAPTDVAAGDDADLCRRLIHALAGTTLLGPVVYRVDETLGPMSIDDPLTGTPRVMATYSIHVRADDAISR